MDAKELYSYALDQATAAVVQVEPRHLHLPTPDTAWDVRDLLEHMLYELAWTADIVTGKTVDEVGDAYDGDLLGHVIQANWRRYEKLARAALKRCDEDATAHLSYGDRTVGEYLWEAGNDQLVHAWDLGQAIGVNVLFEEQVARALYKRAQAMGGALESSGLFGPPVRVAATASAQTKLLATLGRSENWAEGKNR